jgi:hypothetical protein
MKLSLHDIEKLELQEYYLSFFKRNFSEKIFPNGIDLDLISVISKENIFMQECFSYLIDHIHNYNYEYGHNGIISKKISKDGKRKFIYNINGKLETFQTEFGNMQYIYSVDNKILKENIIIYNSSKNSNGVKEYITVYEYCGERLYSMTSSYGDGKVISYYDYNENEISSSWYYKNGDEGKILDKLIKYEYDKFGNCVCIYDVLDDKRYYHQFTFDSMGRLMEYPFGKIKYL